MTDGWTTAETIALIESLVYCILQSTGAFHCTCDKGIAGPAGYRGTFNKCRAWLPSNRGGSWWWSGNFQSAFVLSRSLTPSPASCSSNSARKKIMLVSQLGRGWQWYVRGHWLKGLKQQWCLTSKFNRLIPAHAYAALYCSLLYLEPVMCRQLHERASAGLLELLTDQ